MYKTETTLKRSLRISYPAENGRLVLRTQQDWDKEIESVSVSEDGTTWTFELKADRPFLYFKPCLVRDGEFHWSVGPNKLLLMEEKDVRISYPCFFSPAHGRFSKLVEIQSKSLDRVHKVRVYVPPGYDENTLAYYPVAFMQDGQNLFFPEEAFMGIVKLRLVVDRSSSQRKTHESNNGFEYTRSALWSQRVAVSRRL